jgi:hypothetical protein
VSCRVLSCRVFEQKLDEFLYRESDDKKSCAESSPANAANDSVLSDDAIGVAVASSRSAMEGAADTSGDAESMPAESLPSRLGRGGGGGGGGGGSSDIIGAVDLAARWARTNAALNV